MLHFLQISLSCRFWWEVEDPEGNKRLRTSTAPVTHYVFPFQKGWCPGTDRNGQLNPYIVGCPLGDRSSPPPAAVSLVQTGDSGVCPKAQNCLKVLNLRPEVKKGTLGVCVQALNFLFTTSPSGTRPHCAHVKWMPSGSNSV